MGLNPEQLSITDAEINGVAGVAVSGELDAATSGRLAAAPGALNGASVLLDPEGCTFVDSSGIRTIVEGVRRLANQGRTLVVCNVRTRRARWLNSSNLTPWMACASTSDRPRTK
jgi:anti-anti-sigma factor